MQAGPVTVFRALARKPYSRGRLCTVDILELTSLDLLLFTKNYLDEEVNLTEPSFL